MAKTLKKNPKVPEFLLSSQRFGIHLGLGRMESLMRRLGNPQDGLNCIHIAGTNGKGSTSAMLAGILKSAGFTTGLYTSPFISSFNERMVINGQPITDGELAEITGFCAPLALSM